MVLKYKFEYISNNHTLINFLIKASQELSIENKIIKSEDSIEFYVSEEPEKLLTFSDLLSNYIPMSIFLKNTSVEEVEEMPSQSSYEEIKNEFNLPFCPQCLQEVDNENSVNYNNPFVSCECCTPIKNDKQYVLTKKNETEKSVDYLAVLQKVSNALSNGLKVKIKTFSGTFIFERLENLIQYDKQENLNLLCTNLMNISNVFVAKKSEVVALASLEKPCLNLRVNEIFKSKNIIKTQSANVRYVNDLSLYLLSKELQKENIDFLRYEKEGEYDLFLDIEGLQEEPLLDIPFIKILDNEKVLLLNNKNFNSKLTEMYEKFEEKNKGHFMILLEENSLYNKSIVNFYASSLDDDNISLYTNNMGSFVDILNFELPKNMEEVFAQIRKDETGVRLLDNYKEKFPKDYENALAFDISTLTKKSIVSYWKIARAALGMNVGIINSATSCLLDKGPRIDYKLVEQDKIYNKEFNLAKMIKSGISFKLAGVEDTTIALGYIESYAHFISNVVDEINNEVHLDGISLCGDIFANNLISNFVHKSITKNYKIYYNKDFVIQVS